METIFGKLYTKPIRDTVLFWYGNLDGILGPTHLGFKPIRFLPLRKGYVINVL